MKNMDAIAERITSAAARQRQRAWDNLLPLIAKDGDLSNEEADSLLEHLDVLGLTEGDFAADRREYRMMRGKAAEILTEDQLAKVEDALRDRTARYDATMRAMMKGIVDALSTDELESRAWSMVGWGANGTTGRPSNFQGVYHAAKDEYQRAWVDYRGALGLHNQNQQQLAALRDANPRAAAAIDNTL
jgi:hypothetical protein